MTDRITFETLDRWRACCRTPGKRYDDEHLRARGWPEEGLTPLELSTQKWIPVEDRIWGLLRSEILDDHFQPVLDEIVDPVVREHCLHCGEPDIEAWANKWLSGEDRLVEAASQAVWAAWAAARAARAAARAVWAAARAAEAAEAAARAADAAVWAAARAADAARAAEAARVTSQAAEAASQAAEAAARAARVVGGEEARRKERYRQLRIIRKHLKEME